jgi:hypothetical protein
VVSLPQVSPLRPCTHLSSPPYVPHVQPISFTTQGIIISSPTALLHSFQFSNSMNVRSQTNQLHKTTRCEILFITFLTSKPVSVLTKQSSGLLHRMAGLTAFRRFERTYRFYLQCYEPAKRLTIVRMKAVCTFETVQEASKGTSSTMANAYLISLYRNVINILFPDYFIFLIHCVLMRRD